MIGVSNLKEKKEKLKKKTKKEKKKKKKKKTNSHLTSPSGGKNKSLNMTSLKILTAVTLSASLVRDYNSQK
ncbi:hypothetical protein ACN38_g7062 [Penicillium nordicum]|uniref:Uncharacterized protein n=1 Tax=Penicillium nordicum TaxID=229535 RepID=A0A0M9WET8_9EURO|nr:hypothetical protein ACN38_g7062 [Penicillium nordicum]